MIFQWNIQNFGERPDTGKAYDFKKEIKWLPFMFNLWDAPFTKDQQDQLLSIIYDNQAGLLASWNCTMTITR